MKNRRVLSVICIALCALLILGACNSNRLVKCDWNLSDVEDVVSIHTATQKAYLADNYNKITNYAKGDKELSRPEALRLSWSAKAPEEMTVVGYTVKIIDDNDYYTPIVLDTTSTYVDVYNLCVGTEYFWQVTAHFENGRRSESNWEYFFTEDVAPRNLYVDGITNVRDLGGWTTPEGRVRQGMIFRCGRLNKSETPEVIIEITQSGIDVMRDVLGIKTEIDLRMPNNHNTETGGLTSSPLGEDVNYVNCPLEWDNGNYLMNNLESVRQFFALAADESNYPFIFHCNIGTDRTGMFAFLINGLLGVSEEDLYRDYLFSNFGAINNTRTLSNITNNYLKTINSCSGDTLSERIENCLSEKVGVPQEQIDAIKDIMMEYE